MHTRQARFPPTSRLASSLVKSEVEVFLCLTLSVRRVNVTGRDFPGASSATCCLSGAAVLAISPRLLMHNIALTAGLMTCGTFAPFQIREHANWGQVSLSSHSARDEKKKRLRGIF